MPAKNQHTVSPALNSDEPVEDPKNIVLMWNELDRRPMSRFLGWSYGQVRLHVERTGPVA